MGAAPKEDSNVSSVELVLGALWFFQESSWTFRNRRRRFFVQKLQTAPAPPPTCPLPTPQVPAQLPSALLTASHVYVRRDGCVPPLVPPYLGPFAVVERGQKTFIILMGDRRETVSVDRLEPHLGPIPVNHALLLRRGRLPAFVAAAQSYVDVTAGRGPCSERDAG